MLFFRVTTSILALYVSYFLIRMCITDVFISCLIISKRIYRLVNNYRFQNINIKNYSPNLHFYSNGHSIPWTLQDIKQKVLLHHHISMRRQDCLNQASLRLEVCCGSWYCLQLVMHRLTVLYMVLRTAIRPWSVLLIYIAVCFTATVSGERRYTIFYIQ